MLSYWDLTYLGLGNSYYCAETLMSVEHGNKEILSRLWGRDIPNIEYRGA